MAFRARVLRLRAAAPPQRREKCKREIVRACFVVKSPALCGARRVQKPARFNVADRCFYLARHVARRKQDVRRARARCATAVALHRAGCSTLCSSVFCSRERRRRRRCAARCLADAMSARARVSANVSNNERAPSVGGAASVRRAFDLRLSSSFIDSSRVRAFTLIFVRASCSRCRRC